MVKDGIYMTRALTKEGKNALDIDKKAVDKIIKDHIQKIQQLQIELHQAEGYKQALIDMESKEEEPEEDKT